MKKGVDYIGVTVPYFCHDGEGNYLFNKRSTNCRDEHGRWDNGGGGLEFGEQVLDRLRTEVKEEYGADVLEHEFLGFRDVHREHEGKPTHWISIDFRVRVERGQVKNGEPHKFDAVEWFRLDALPEPLHSQVPAAIEKYRTHLE